MYELSTSKHSVIAKLKGIRRSDWMRDKAEPEVIIIGNYLQDKQESMIRVSSLYKDIADENGIKTSLIRPADRFVRLRFLELRSGFTIG